MIFTGSLTLAAGQAEVWPALLDVDAVAVCIPGLESHTQIDERTFDGVIAARVGPVAGRFAFRARITASDPLRELQASFEGSDSVSKSIVNGETIVTLRALDGARTELSYQSSVTIDGRLAILGDIVLRATGDLLLKETLARLRRGIERARLSEGL